MRDLDPAYGQGVGQQAGLEIWQIEDSRLRNVEKCRHGIFFANKAYIVLQTCIHPTSGLRHNIHCWFGETANKNETATATIKAVELNATLRGGAVQTQENMGYESDRFLSYFKPCFIPLAQCNSFEQTTKVLYQTRMFSCEGKHVVRVKEVPISRSSLRRDGIFVVDTQHKIYQFNGASTDTYARVKALDVVQYLMNTFHKEKCSIAVIEDGKFVADADSGEFWALFGGFAPLMRRLENGSHEIELSPGKLYLIQDCQINKTQALPLEKEKLDTSKTYILDCGNEIFVWMGNNTTSEDRKAAVLLSQEFCSKRRDPHQTRLTYVCEDHEPLDFRLKFETWPVAKQQSCSESGRVKVAVLLKQRGLNVQGLLKPAPAAEDLQLKSSSRNLQIWCAHGVSKVVLPLTETIKFNSYSCYVVAHSCSINQKDEHFIYTWFGNQSSMDTKETAACHAKDVAASFPGNSVEVRIFQDSEPKHFLSLFNTLIVTKDGMTEGENSLFQMRSSSSSKWHAVQVKMAATSLNSSSCFFLLNKADIFIWYGKFTSLEEHEATKSMANQLKPDAKITSMKEGAELQSFWRMLSGKQVYQSHHVPTESARSPRLFSFTVYNDQLKLTEVFNFTQEDLLSNEVMIIDCHTSIFVWVGKVADKAIKLKALEFGQKYLDLITKYEGNHSNPTIYRIHEGSEPFLFTSLFSWDNAKIMQYHNIFERKLLALQGEPKKLQQIITVKSFLPLSNGKSFQVEKDRITKTFKMEQTSNKFCQPKIKAGHKNAPEEKISEKSVAIAPFFTINELQKGREAPLTTPVVKLSPLSLKPKRPMREVPPPTPCSRTTPKTAISPAIASLTSVYESYNDRFAFAWPGMKLRHEERALSRDVDTFDCERVEVESMPGSPVQAHRAVEEQQKEQQRELEQEAQEQKQQVYAYDRLKVSSSNPILRIDSSRRESYLSNKEFQEIFLMDKETFYKLPKWKQSKYKVILDLF